MNGYPFSIFLLAQYHALLFLSSSRPRKWAALVHITLMAVGILVGVIGTAFHLNAILNPLGSLTWTWVVFGSPILAPLAFAGISLLGLYAITEEVEGQEGILNVPGLGIFHAPSQELNIFSGLSALGLVQVH